MDIRVIEDFDQKLLDKLVELFENVVYQNGS